MISTQNFFDLSPLQAAKRHSKTRVLIPTISCQLGQTNLFFFEYIIPFERAAGTNHPRNQLCQVSAPILLRPKWQPGQWGACSVGFPQPQLQ